MTPDLDLKAAREPFALNLQRTGDHVAAAMVRRGEADEAVVVQMCLSAILIRQEMEAANG